MAPTGHDLTAACLGRVRSPPQVGTQQVDAENDAENDAIFPTARIRITRLEQRTTSCYHGRGEPMATDPSARDDSPAPSRSLRERLAGFVLRTRERAERARSSFTVHGVTYAAVNSLLLLINLLFSPGFLWALFPVAGWGIGLLHHYTEMRGRARDARDAAALPPVTKRAMQQVRKLFSSRRRLRHHLSTVAGLSAFLAGINIFLDSGGGPWAIIPIWVLSIPLAIHFVVARTRRRRLLGLLREAGVELAGGQAAELAALEAEATAVLPADAPLLAEAAELREAILGELRDGGKEAARWRSELQPELEAYTQHIGALLQARKDLERAGARVSAAEVTQELAALRGKLDEATSAELRREYQTAVDQYESQLKSLQDLQERMEMIELRAKSAVLSLQQLSLDIPRLRSAPAGESAALLSLRDKSQELTQYLDDLRAGHQELEGAGVRAR